MIGDDGRQIGGRCLFLQDGSGVRDMREQRSVRKERVPRDENNARIGPTIAGEVRDGGSFLERMGSVVCWNSVMDENQYMVRKWNEFIAA